MKATIPSFQAKSLVCPGIVYEHERVTYLEREDRKKKKGKRPIEATSKVELQVLVVPMGQ